LFIYRAKSNEGRGVFVMTRFAVRRERERRKRDQIRQDTAWPWPIRVQTSRTASFVVSLKFTCCYYGPEQPYIIVFSNDHRAHDFIGSVTLGAQSRANVPRMLHCVIGCGCPDFIPDTINLLVYRWQLCPSVHRAINGFSGHCELSS